MLLAYALETRKPTYLAYSLFCAVGLWTREADVNGVKSTGE